MSRMKDWLLEHEEAFGEALETNPKTLGDVLNYVHDKMQVVDDEYIHQLWHKRKEGDLSRETLKQQKEREKNNGRQED